MAAPKSIIGLERCKRLINDRFNWKISSASVEFWAQKSPPARPPINPWPALLIPCVWRSQPRGFMLRAAK